MKVELDAQLILEVQEFFGLPDPALVEKDYWVVQSLLTLANLRLGDDIRLVFGGGTALGRAHRLIKRMSEDIDLKIVCPRALSRAELRKIRSDVCAALSAAGFLIDQADENSVLSRNASKYTLIRLPYPTVLDQSSALRPGIQIELTVSGARVPTVTLPITSFVAEATEQAPEIAAMACVATSQTLAEKFVALTRRVGEQRQEGAEMDEHATRELGTLLRHLYDLHVVLTPDIIDEVLSMIPAVLEGDRHQYGRSFPAYLADPSAAIMATIEAMEAEAIYAEQFQAFHQAMVYGEQVGFAEAMATLRGLAVSLPSVGKAN